jgi:hypothetical protein
MYLQIINHSEGIDMDYAFAKQLHNDDEVTVIKTGEVVSVVSTEFTDQDVWVEAMTAEGYTRLHCTEIK